MFKMVTYNYIFYILGVDDNAFPLNNLGFNIPEQYLTILHFHHK
jgi:hypothetical protein